MLTGLRELLRYTRATTIVGDILKVRARDIGLGDMAVVEMPNGEQLQAQVIQLEGDEISLQVILFAARNAERACAAENASDGTTPEQGVRVAR